MKKLAKSIWIFSIVLTVLVGFASCSKDDEDEIVDPTSILTSKTWTVADYDVQNGDLASQINAIVVAGFEPSQFKFEANGVLKYVAVLSTSESTGTWALSSDNKTITLKDEDAEMIYVAEITEAKSTSLKWKVTFTKADLESTSDVTVLFVLTPKA